jgi:hypothetical protein
MLEGLKRCKPQPATSTVSKHTAKATYERREVSGQVKLFLRILPAVGKPWVDSFHMPWKKFTIPPSNTIYFRRPIPNPTWFPSPPNPSALAHRTTVNQRRFPVGLLLYSVIQMPRRQWHLVSKWSHQSSWLIKLWSRCHNARVPQCHNATTNLLRRGYGIYGCEKRLMFMSW